MVTKAGVSNRPFSSFFMRILPYLVTFGCEMHQIMESLKTLVTEVADHSHQP